MTFITCLMWSLFIIHHFISIVKPLFVFSLFRFTIIKLTDLLRSIVPKDCLQPVHMEGQSQIVWAMAEALADCDAALHKIALVKGDVPIEASQEKIICTT